MKTKPQDAGKKLWTTLWFGFLSERPWRFRAASHNEESTSKLGKCLPASFLATHIVTNPLGKPVATEHECHKATQTPDYDCNKQLSKVWTSQQKCISTQHP